MSSEVAERWRDTCLRALTTPYPYEAAHRSIDRHDTDVTPSRLHPSFHGAFDWHSSVHMQWSLVTLIERYPRCASEDVVDLLDERLHLAAIEVEVAYLRDRLGWERPYGWAWAARLAATIRTSTDPIVGRWLPAASLLSDAVADLVDSWLRSAPRTIRHGLHQNTAFSLSLLHDAASAEGRDDLVARISDAALQRYSSDTDVDTRLEPSGSDIFSPTLSEAALMARLLDRPAFRRWFSLFLPDFGGAGQQLLSPPLVEDSTDGAATHWSGLALSRAAQLSVIAAALDDERRDALSRAAADHRIAAERVVTEGDFMSTHWLVTFALLAEQAAEKEAER